MVIGAIASNIFLPVLLSSLLLRLAMLLLLLIITVGAKSSSAAVSTQAATSKPGTVPLVSATSRIIHPEEDTSLVSCRNQSVDILF